MAKGSSVLTPRQERFVDEYLVDGNATQAAIRAGFTKKNADVMGPRLVRKSWIAKEIDRRRSRIVAKVDKKLEITEERVRLEYARLGFSDMGKFAQWDDNHVTMTPSSELTPDDTAAVSEIVATYGKDGTPTVRLKLHDKKGALDSMAKTLGMFAPEQVDINANVQIGHARETVDTLIVRLKREESTARDPERLNSGTEGSDGLSPVGDHRT
jgi:phage terminase small subunit